jgi:hypothetical protein
MQKLRYYSIGIHLIFVFFFITRQTLLHLVMLIAPLLHLLILRNDSSCYPDHCKSREVFIPKANAL